MFKSSLFVLLYLGALLVPEMPVCVYVNQLKSETSSKEVPSAGKEKGPGLFGQL